MASARNRLRPAVWKNSSTALSSNEGELARSITTCAPARPCFSPSPVMVLKPLCGAAARTSCPPRRRIATVLAPIRPMPPITTTFIVCILRREERAGQWLAEDRLMSARESAMAGIKDAPQPCGLYEIGAHVAVPNILWSSDWSVAPGPMLRTTITFSSTNCSQDTCVPMKVGGSACRATRPLPRGPKGSDGIPANWTVEVPTHWGLTWRQHRRPGPPSGNAGQYLLPSVPERRQRSTSAPAILPTSYSARSSGGGKQWLKIHS